MKLWFSLASLVFLHLRFSQANLYNSTALVLATDDHKINQASYLLNGYGITFESFEFTQANQNLPSLESLTGGKYGLIVIVSQLVVNGTSLLTETQWTILYDYQVKYGVRMVHLNVIPSLDFGVKGIGSCCNNGVEQSITLVKDMAEKEFPTAGLKTTARLSTLQLFHFPASILEANFSTTTAIAEFQPNPYYTEASVAAVINKFDTGREQMAFFLAVGNWSTTSTYLGHAWINWGYRGTYQGYRRIHFSTQVDDLFLSTIISNTGDPFRVRAEDMELHLLWSNNINKRLSAGSSYFTEFGFNFNGNLDYSYIAGENLTQYTCDAPILGTWEEPTSLEYVKPPGTGTNVWPYNPKFEFTGQCIFLDPIARFFANTSNRDSVGLVSHSFTHLNFDRATHHDGFFELAFNLFYAELMNFTNGAKFSGSGLIPPAITGLHNGDVIRAWTENGIWNAVGDNTRPLLRNSENYHWPVITTMALSGYSGFQITPRFATRIYYDCDQAEAQVLKWIENEDRASGSTIYNLLEEERTSVGNQLISLFHDPYMFHQSNLRSWDVKETMINGKLQKLSLLQMWVETVVAEIDRLVTWPIITLKHDHIAETFTRRMLLDACEPVIQFITTNRKISGFTVLSNFNICEVPIPITVLQNVTDTKGFVTEQRGSDPMTLWVKLDGQAVTFTFS